MCYSYNECKFVFPKFLPVWRRSPLLDTGIRNCTAWINAFEELKKNQSLRGGLKVLLRSLAVRQLVRNRVNVFEMDIVEWVCRVGIVLERRQQLTCRKTISPRNNHTVSWHEYFPYIPKRSNSVFDAHEGWHDFCVSFQREWNHYLLNVLFAFATSNQCLGNAGASSRNHLHQENVSLWMPLCYINGEPMGNRWFTSASHQLCWASDWDVEWARWKVHGVRWRALIWMER